MISIRPKDGTLYDGTAASNTAGGDRGAAAGTKRRALLGHLEHHACVLLREGASHSQTGRREAVLRHNEIKKYLARSICRHFSVPEPTGD